MREIGNRIIELRESKGLSANHLANAVAVDPSTINKIERGVSKPSVDLIFRLCDFFQISESEFFNDGIVDNEEERQLLVAYRRLSPDKQEQAIRLIRAL